MENKEITIQIDKQTAKIVAAIASELADDPNFTDRFYFVLKTLGIDFSSDFGIMQFQNENVELNAEPIVDKKPITK